MAQGSSSFSFEMAPKFGVHGRSLLKDEWRRSVPAERGLAANSCGAAGVSLLCEFIVMTNESFEIFQTISVHFTTYKSANPSFGPLTGRVENLYMGHHGSSPEAKLPFDSCFLPDPGRDLPCAQPPPSGLWLAQAS